MHFNITTNIDSKSKTYDRKSLSLFLYQEINSISNNDHICDFYILHDQTNEVEYISYGGLKINSELFIRNMIN